MKCTCGGSVHMLSHTEGCSLFAPEIPARLPDGTGLQEDYSDGTYAVEDDTAKKEE